ncbi:hypothetical protein SUGI_1151170 [Cryptomeria japonica]|nr:hypothetical protein SUGI_1151170 [Cryptomeria japonica]
MFSSTISGRSESDPANTATFHEIAPSASASGTSSTLIQKPCYDVFINHRGPDVKETLASSIYNLLADMKVAAFLDSEELDYGDFLPTAIEAAIRGATLHIAIFSKRYAESPWCLAELSSMLKSGAKIVPVFYHVEPNDLRYVAKGTYADYFERHEEKCRYSPQKLKEWKEALSEVSFYSGEIIKNDDDEVRLLKNIVNIVLKEISNVSLVVAKYPVGLNEAVEDFENTVQLAQVNSGTQIVGIWGMGGSGKTTLAKELYNKRSSSMERSSFIFDIREAKGVLYKKQVQLLKDLGVTKTFDNVEQGKAILARHLRSFRMLIVMDDVDHVDQLDVLLPAKDSLGRGSLIIVTTRECEVLKSWGISFIYKMKPLDLFNAKKLFCRHAFLQSSPFDGFEELVKNFVEACHGLPLSLKVFGAQLYGDYDKRSWGSLFHKMSRILDDDIKKKLKVSYDALGNEEKEAFLDTACFFIEEKNSLAIQVWDGSGWSGLYSWKRLLNKCLVELDDNGRIRMHDHLRDLGREIANQQSPYRLWSLQQIINANKQNGKVNVIRGIKDVPIGINKQRSYSSCLSLFRGCCSQGELAPNISGRILFPAPSLAGLKLLVIKGDHCNEVISEVSTELVWLRWLQIGHRNLPTRLSLKKLRVLELHENYEDGHHLEELWKAENDAPVQLRELVITNCNKFKKFPNSIGCLNELTRIVIKGQNNIKSLPQEFCRLQLLEHLELRSCKMLSSLPSSFGDLTNLQYLDLSWCRNLRSLPISFKNLMLLQYLNLLMCRELIVRSDDFQNIAKLEFLSVSGCVQLEELPPHIINQTSLREFYLEGVKRLRELPIKIGQLRRLQKMTIGSDSLKSLPNSLGDLSSLTHLSIRDCPNLKSLPNSLGNLSSLTDLLIEDCRNLKSLPNSLRDMSSLTHLSIEYCPNLESLPTSLGNLSSLTHFSIQDCPKLKFLNVGHLNLSQSI